MNCPNGHEMTQEEVLCSRTTTPYEEDHFETMWWCDTCEHAEPIEEDHDE